MGHRYWWFSTVNMTVYVETNHKNLVIKTAPITRKFLNQPVKNLADWLRKQKDFRWYEYK